MRIYFLLILVFASSVCSSEALSPEPPASTMRLVFIHHSVGENWLADGGLLRALNENNYYVSDTNYGWDPESIGDQTDIGQWYNWFLGPNRDIYTGALYDNRHLTEGIGQNTIRNPGGANTIVMFKSCFYNGQMIGGNPDDPPLPKGANNPIKGEGVGDTYTVSNIKALYRDLLDYFALHQDKLFVLITTPPSLRENVSSKVANNLRAINSWLVKEWLVDYTHNNVFVFDYYNVLTSNGGNPDTNDLDSENGNHHRLENGQIEHVIHLKNDFLSYGLWGDDHPTAAGHQKATGEFIPLLNIAYNHWISPNQSDACVKGDVDKDNDLGADDAILVLQFAVNLKEPSDYQRCAADMNGDGEIRSDDAILILRKIVGLAAPSTKDSKKTNQVTLALGEVSGVTGESIRIPLRVNTSDLAGGDILICYDDTVLRAIDVLHDSDTILASNITQPGIISIAFAKTGRLNNRTIAEIKYDVISNSVSPLRFGTATLYQFDSSPIELIAANGRFASLAIPTDQNALLQNFPNPFNPDTWIPYQLEEKAYVAIEIYHISGKLVRTIDIGHKTAGSYITKDRAAYWDGRNEAGETIASGVYFVVLKAGKYQKAQRIVLIR